MAAQATAAFSDHRGGDLSRHLVQLTLDDTRPVGVEHPRAHRLVEPAQTGRSARRGVRAGSARQGKGHALLAMDMTDRKHPGQEVRGIERAVAERSGDLDHGAVLGILALDRGHPCDRGVLCRRGDVSDVPAQRHKRQPLRGRPRRRRLRRHPEQRAKVDGPGRPGRPHVSIHPNAFIHGTPLGFPDVVPQRLWACRSRYTRPPTVPRAPDRLAAGTTYIGVEEASICCDRYCGRPTRISASICASNQSA